MARRRLDESGLMDCIGLRLIDWVFLGRAMMLGWRRMDIEAMRLRLLD